ncbi:class F sortase [Kribbella sp. NPDC023855]|uniref:class F sortase n=1 Tax=Kribbella sp. NPDC023855 TaxID=3154698 RepID=UPI0033DCA284
MITRRGAVVLVTTALACLGLLTGCGNSSTTAGARKSAEPAVSSPRPTATTPGAQPSATGPRPAVRTRDAELPPVIIVGQPSRLQIESVNLDLAIQAVGVGADGQMELPPNPAVVGWYKFGPTPSDPQGSAVLGGHLDSKEFGSGPLVRLRKLRPGDDVRVRSSDGSTAKYRVQLVREVPKTQLAVEDLFDRAGDRKLRIVTCGGRYDRDRGGYRDNVVITAVAATG